MFQSKPVAPNFNGSLGFLSHSVKSSDLHSNVSVIGDTCLAFLDALFDMFNASFANRSVYFRLFVISLLGFFNSFLFLYLSLFCFLFFYYLFLGKKRVGGSPLNMESRLSYRFVCHLSYFLQH